MLDFVKYCAIPVLVYKTVRIFGKIITNQRVLKINIREIRESGLGKSSFSRLPRSANADNRILAAKNG